MGMPELGPVKVGDTLYVRETSRRGSGPVEVVVTKVGRVWIEMNRPDDVPSLYPQYRMRLDTQNTGRRTGEPEYFMSPAQLAWRDRERAAGEFLKELGIWTHEVSRGRYKDRTAELANIIRVHEGLPEL